LKHELKNVVELRWVRCNVPRDIQQDFKTK